MNIRLFLCCVFCCAITLRAQEAVPEKADGLRKTATSIEDAFGVLDKGEMINTFGNQGMISDSYYQNLIFNFGWPKSMGVANIGPDDNKITNDVDLVFGRKKNVIDGHSRFRNEDWIGLEGSNGKYFADDQPAELLAPDGGPRMAHSDLPKTWPKGYWDTLRVWHPAPAGPFEALSPGDQALVTLKAAWYDADKSIWRFWPGRWRIDVDSLSPTYRQELPGQFAADREVFTIFSDRNTQLPDTALGILVRMQAYSYGRRFAQDIQIYDMLITNTSSVTLDSCWFGYQMDPRYGDTNNEDYDTYNSGINSKGYDNVVYTWDYNGATSSNRGYMTGKWGCAVLGTPKDVGITDGHLWRGNATWKPTKAKRDIWPVMCSDTADPAIASKKSNYFHGPDYHFDDFNYAANLPTDFRNFAFYITSGPFTLNPGETTRATVAFTAGWTLEHFQRNVATAQQLFLSEFNGPSVPPSPRVSGVAGDRRNTIYWSDSPERVQDVLTKKLDFEGYKVYRSQDQGSTWGKQILDAQGRAVGYIPIAQFDKKDLIQGIDPQNNYNYLGSETGLSHMFVDTTVDNGVEYSYTVTSYDTGDPTRLESFESSRGTTAADANLVDLTPRSDPAGLVPAQVNVTKSSTPGKGDVRVTIVDPSALSSQQFNVTFHTSPADSFFVYNANNVLQASAPMASDEMPVVDGFRLRITSDTKDGGVKSVTDENGLNVAGPANRNTGFRWFVTTKDTVTTGDAVTNTSDYEFRFTSGGSYADSVKPNGQPMTAKYRVPFEVWNLTGPQPTQVNVFLYDVNANGALDLSEKMLVVNIPYGGATGVGQPLGTFDNRKVPGFTVRIDTLAADSSFGAHLPATGQSFKITTYGRLTAQDTFHVSFQPQTIVTSKAISRAAIDGVRVVPNPYIGAASWEQIRNTRKLRFMFLPAACTISIYTVRGELVRRLDHGNGTGDEDWNLTNQSGMEVAFGVYIYVIQTPDGERGIGKFSIIK